MDINDDMKLQIKQMIVETLNIKDVNPEEILNDKSLFTGENTITLDSIDGIELIMAIQRKFGVRLDDQNLARNILNTVDSMAEFISGKTV
ncbi:MAG: phosphopantetheine-binding protein [Bacteroidales bacterium]|jgi:acyl carrier protein|nr:phosphopantetheine-binding protein [Bacteroidales bacterium]MDD4215339.1 phosphopantetheine-binding protein [Bacteroidales bacterium]